MAKFKAYHLCSGCKQRVGAYRILENHNVCYKCGHILVSVSDLITMSELIETDESASAIMPSSAQWAELDQKQLIL